VRLVRRVIEQSYRRRMPNSIYERVHDFHPTPLAYVRHALDHRHACLYHIAC
jgi:hypothetical protein